MADRTNVDRREEHANGTNTGVDAAAPTPTKFPVTPTPQRPSLPPRPSFPRRPSLGPRMISRDFRSFPIPRRLRYDYRNPWKFGWGLNVMFAIACTLIIANLYYCQPILIEMAKTFDVDYDEVSTIPSLIQAGYAMGLLFISPLGDLVRRRPLMLVLLLLCASLSIGLAITPSLPVFKAVNFLVGIVSVGPQILMPFAADLAPPERRASAISVILSGLLFGVLIARVLSGIIAQYASWRVVYYMAVGVQFAVLGGLYLLLPDHPARNPQMTYLGILKTMGKYAVTEPILVQATLISFASVACFSNFWTTLTFLLGGEPYNYSTLEIGLFGLIGMCGVATGPFAGRIVDRLVPWYGILIGTIGYACFQAIQTGAGGINIAAVVVACFGLDLFRQMQQISFTTVVYSIDARATARLNAVVMIAIFLGQVMGSSVGTQVFTRYGWRASAALSMGWMGFQLLILLVRGPHCARYTWFGYEGGWEARKGIALAKLAREEEEKVLAELQKQIADASVALVQDRRVGKQQVLAVEVMEDVSTIVEKDLADMVVT